MNKKEKTAIYHYQNEKIRNAEKEIYENISQCLCLARLQLGHLDLENKERSFAVIAEVNLLIGKAVMDLRNLARQLSIPQKHYKK